MRPWFPSSVQSEVREVGGKGHHLQKLMAWGAPVAPFFVISTECFKRFKSEGHFPAELEGKIESFLKLHPTIALRSSMTTEDAADASFAGIFDTVLGVTQETWREALAQVYRSMEAPRVKEYLERKGLEVDLEMAVVVQEQVDVEKSGVLFTRSPVAPTAAVAIDAAFGMGEGVVSGHSSVDHYQFTRGGELILEMKNNERRVLSEGECNELLRNSLILEAHHGVASDIEWGFKGGKLHIFQIRPITRSFEPLTFLVDTNLSESYPGTVSPFTGKFVQKAYQNVFKESALALGLTESRIGRMEMHYSRLISCVDNHLYYNLEHYYAVLKALPGGKGNIDNWHRMIGGRPPSSEVPEHGTELSRMESVSAKFSLLGLALRHGPVFERLLLDLERTKNDILQEQGRLKTSRETTAYLAQLLDRPLGFGLTLVNDLFIMAGLGYLTRSLKKKGVSEENVIDVLKTDHGVDSLRPLHLFDSLVEGLSEAFIESLGKTDVAPGFTPYVELFQRLREEGFMKEVKRMEEFLDEYGDRSFEELKLESLPLRNNPMLLIQLIKWARKNPSVIQKASPKDLPLKLSWIDGKIVAFTRRSIAMRETTRLWRGKFYHLLRSLILRLGQQLQDEDPRWSEFSVLDFFSLDHREWKDFGLGRISFPEAKQLILDRRGWQSKRQQYPEMIMWTEHERLPALGSAAPTSGISGQGVSPGITEGTALVLENPGEALESKLTDFILVTKNTDPAWVYIMSRSLGLISEKGSLLSHTAIIGRELNVPTIVGVRGATQQIKTGDRLRMDATTGRIEVL